MVWFKAIILAPFSMLFWVLLKARLAFYKIGLLKQKSLPVPILCVGNLTTGGTGKTPWVKWFTQNLGQTSLAPIAILSRGYGGAYKGILQVEEGTPPLLSGEEPLWLKLNTKVQVVLSKSRYQAGKRALGGLQRPGLLILDDGFQHLSLRRDADILIFDASRPLKDYRLLPWGHLREPFSAVQRAQIVIIHKCNWATGAQVRYLHKRCQKFISPQQIFQSDYVFSGWESLAGTQTQLASGSQVALLTAIGNPHNFTQVVTSQGLEVVYKRVATDHHYWGAQEINDLAKAMPPGVSNVVTTEKDAIKLKDHLSLLDQVGLKVWVCHMQISLYGRDKELMALVEKALLSSEKET